MANTKITTNVIADDAVTSDKLGGDLTMPGHVSLADNKELRVGTGNDLVIKHDGSHTTLTNTTGNFTLLGDAVYIGNAANNEYLAQFIANGAASLRYDNTEQLATVSGGVYIPNKLGIGTNSPTQKLDVRGGTGAGTLTHAIFTGTAGRGVQIRTRSDTSGGQNSGTAEINSADSEGTGGDLAFSSNGNVRMFIDGGGSVGIGTNSPQTYLHIGPLTGGNNAAQERLRISGDYTATNSGSLIRFTNQHNSATTPNSGEYNVAGIKAYDYRSDWGGAIALQTAPNTSTGGTLTDRLTITPEGYVGIGTTSPARTVEINGGGYNQLMIASVATSNSNKLAGIESRNYSNYALGLMQMFANSSQTGLYHGSADSSAKGVTSHYFMTSPSVDSATNNTAMTINSVGNVDILDGDLSFASGHGINFAATGNSSGNLGSELFDDYEEGTWTPILIAGTTNPTGGGAQAPSGRYTKIGNRVFVTFYVGRTWTNSPAGGIYVMGLPFTIHSSTNGYYPANVSTYNITYGSSHFPFIIPNAGQTTFQFYKTANGGAWDIINWTDTPSAILYVTGEFSYHST